MTASSPAGTAVAGQGATRRDGTADVQHAVHLLASDLPESLEPLAHLAYNLRWTWTPGGDAVFATIAPQTWDLVHHNPVRLLREVDPAVLDEAATREDLVDRARALRDSVIHDLNRPAVADWPTPGRPVTFLCAEFGLHRSLPIYAGGLGVLAGDLLKSASDACLPCVGVGLLYRQGYFRQRIDASGWQHEYWPDASPDLRPAVLVTDRDGGPLRVPVPIEDRVVVVHVWRVDVGRVPLYLLDADLPENAPVDRWITSRLYIADRHTRLRQYAVLGVGGMLALRAMGWDPAVVHLNEGHAAFASLMLVAEEVGRGATYEHACDTARERVVFTTHTPVAAGNEVYPSAEVASVLRDVVGRLRTDEDAVLDLGRTRPGDAGDGFGLTPLGIRLSRSTNAVSRRHGDVTRTMWDGLPAGRLARTASVTHVTNGVHLATWMAEPMRALLDGHLAADWWRSPRPDLTGLDEISDSELWEVRCRLRAQLVDYVRERSTGDRLGRGEPVDYAVAAEAFDPGRLTIGFARRLATYKRLNLLMFDHVRSLALLGGDRPVQMVIAGKAHPQDDEAKGLLRALFAYKNAPNVAGHVVFLEDYDMAMAARLVAGCDVWVNLPRPPLEASGTSGMKAALNGAVNASVLDGWWAEAYDGVNGWAVGAPEPLADAQEQDAADAEALYSLIEGEIVPLFHERDADGIPAGWMRRVRASLRTAISGFTAARMVDDYMREVYRTTV